MQVGVEYIYLPLLVLGFLLIDLLIEIDSSKALLSNPFFWLYWLVYSIAAEASLYFLSIGTHPTIAHLPKAILILIAIVATTTILQSLTFKVGGKRVLDLSQYLSDYRQKVLSSSGALAARYANRRILFESSLILRKAQYQPGVAASEDRMKAMYAEVMLFGSRKPEAVQREIAKLIDDCTTTGATFGALVARRVAQADPEWVRNFLKK